MTIVGLLLHDYPWIIPGKLFGKEKRQRQGGEMLKMRGYEKKLSILTTRFAFEFVLYNATTLQKTNRTCEYKKKREKLFPIY